jgi:hypothetical protein
MRSTTLRVVAAAVALGGITAYAFTSRFLFFFALVIPAVLLLATSFSEAGRLAEAIQGFLHHTAEVRVWGAALPVPDGATITVTSVKALSAGLHVFLRVSPGASPTHLKVAQPGRAQVLPRLLTIESAAYVQWAGKRLPRVAGAPALTVSLDPPEDSARGSADGRRAGA